MALNSISSIALGGMTSAVQRLGAAASHVARFGTTQPEDVGDGGLAKNMVEERVALYAFKANMQTFKTEQEMLGTLLDIRA
ncbi:hypothetical protein [Aquabacterium sp.]|uniref:hypothetical protein n=1 Tax=Aquabacterium sp. TaxID=1872578 RepID=UPI002C1D94E2|nr:hypothetical protein [Aquabacterium sp.]HSW07500.1 hypothetical protein [Aquabacterium sp.]